MHLFIIVIKLFCTLIIATHSKFRETSRKSGEYEHNRVFLDVLCTIEHSFYSVEEFRVTEAWLRARSNGYHFTENRKDLTSQFHTARIFHSQWTCKLVHSLFTANACGILNYIQTSSEVRFNETLTRWRFCLCQCACCFDYLYMYPSQNMK